MSSSKEQADYESLVRQQLTELGYNSEAIPDAVRFFPCPQRLRPEGGLLLCAEHAIRTPHP